MTPEQLMLMGRPVKGGSVAAPTFRAAGTIGYGTSSVVAAVPAGVQAGDLLILAYGAQGNATDPSGWNIIDGGVLNYRLKLWWKIATASESAVTISTSSTNTSAAMVAYSGVNASPIDALGTEVNVTNGTSIATASFTTTVPNTVVISGYFGNITASGVWTAPAGTSVRIDTSGGSSTGRMLLLCDEVMASAGATTARTASELTATRLASFAFSIKP